MFFGFYRNVRWKYTDDAAIEAAREVMALMASDSDMREKRLADRLASDSDMREKRMADRWDDAVKKSVNEVVAGISDTLQGEMTRGLLKQKGRRTMPTTNRPAKVEVGKIGIESGT